MTRTRPEPERQLQDAHSRSTIANPLAKAG